MNCPYCRTEMKPGKIALRGVANRPGNGTFFRAIDGDGDGEDILEMTTRDAFQCADCATLTIKGRFAGDEKAEPGTPYRE